MTAKTRPTSTVCRVPFTSRRHRHPRNTHCVSRTCKRFFRVFVALSASLVEISPIRSRGGRNKGRRHSGDFLFIYQNMYVLGEKFSRLDPILEMSRTPERGQRQRYRAHRERNFAGRQHSAASVSGWWEWEVKKPRAAPCCSVLLPFWEDVI